MEVKIEDLSYGELIDLYKASKEFMDILKIEEKAEIEKGKK